MISQKIQLFGKVQGVYFRSSAKQKAEMLGVKGTVCNESDGSVSMQIEGDERAVNQMIDWCKSGPALARVSEIKTEEFEWADFPNFSIKK